MRMNGFNPKSQLIKYRVCLLSAAAIWLAFAVLLLHFFGVEIYVFCILFGMVLYRIIALKLRFRFIESHLISCLDPERYSSIISAGKVVSKYKVEQIYITYFSGAYGATVKLCNACLEDKKCHKFKYLYMNYLARAYFAIGDLDNLRAVCDSFNTAVAAEKNCEKIKSRNLYFKFVELYLDEDYIGCRDLYADVIANESKYNPKGHRISSVQIKFTYAVSLYLSDDFERAASLFDEIIMMAPKLNISSLSSDYLAAIESGKAYTSREYDIAAEMETYELPLQRKAVKLLLSVRIAVLALLIAMLIALLVFKSFAPRVPAIFKGLDNFTTRADVIELYGEPITSIKPAFADRQYIDVYRVNYMGIPCNFEFMYCKDSDLLESATLNVRCTEFENLQEYKEAVDKTYEQFSKLFSRYEVSGEIGVEQTEVKWTSQKRGVAYTMIECDYNGTDSDAAWFIFENIN